MFAIGLRHSTNMVTQVLATQHNTTKHYTPHDSAQHDTTSHDTIRHNATRHDTTQHNLMMETACDVPDEVEVGRLLSCISERLR